MDESPYLSSASSHAGPPPDPAMLKSWRQARIAAMVQLASPFVFSGTILAGLVWEIPTAGGDVHGYVQIFGFFASVFLLMLMLILTAVAAAYVNRGHRAGSVMLIIVSAVAIIESLGLASGMPGGIGQVTLLRIVTIVIGVLWTGVSVLCVLAAARTFSASPTPRAPTPPR